MVLDELRAEFLSLPGDFERYTYLTELSALLPEADIREGANLYRGCQSSVWLRVGVRDGIFHMDADSDALIIRGVLYLFHAVLDGLAADDVKSMDFDLTAELGIDGLFTSRRASGIGGLPGEIKRRLGA